MLALEGVNVSIAGVRVLRDVSASLAPGRTTVLIGRNGAGKTTTLRSVMGLLPVTSGLIRLGSETIGATPSHHRARQGIGYAPEDRRLVADFTVEENILLPALALALPTAERTRRLDEIYSLLPQLLAMRARSGGAVSGGQGKMVALARALMVARSALLLDEPFQGLAPALALDYGRTLGELRQRRSDLTILITESTPALLETMADDNLLIERGAISRATQGVPKA